MLKAIFASTALVLSAPLMAQVTDPSAPSAADTTAPDTTTVQPDYPAPAPDTAPAEPTLSDEATTSEADATAEPTEAPADPTSEPNAAQTADAASGNPADAVQQVIESEFAGYDADGDGELTKEEFGRWMTALRSQQAEGSAGTDAAGWTDAAFAQADTDSSSSVSRGELTSFLQG